ncbi:MAG: ThiF family adenylyltransferase [Candidatus Saccharimonadales bacterium]
MSRDFSDQTGFFNPDDFAWPVHLIGAGGIGSALVLNLAKMGVRELHLWDDDVLEPHNGPVELSYSEAMMGKSKLEAAQATVEFMIGLDNIRLVLHHERVTRDTALSGVVISGVDSMASRAEIWQGISDNFLDIPLYIDARSAGEEVMIFGFSPSDFEVAAEYSDDWLYPDEEATNLDCGAKNIAYIANMIAGEVGRIIARFYRELPIEFRFARDYSKN